ncbi:MAG: hypothetical protein P1V97_06855 [Planctomycetota bacterium]|nr:hypothetical protein [Planctomycetota bacterium]
MAKHTSPLPILIIGGIVTILLTVIGVWFANHDGLFEKLWVMVKHNPIFWITGLISLAGTAFFWKRDPEEFTFGEAVIQIALSLVTIVLFFALFSYWFTDVQDVEFWNSRVILAEHWETWDEQKEDSKGNYTHTKHPPHWTLHTTMNERVSISESQYENIVQRFGNQSYERINRAYRVSHSDGNRYFTTYNGKADTEIPASVEHSFTNWVKASKESEDSSELLARFKELLKDYPSLEASDYGPIKVDRVIQAGTDVPEDYCAKLDAGLDSLLAEIGARKQVNILIYLVNTTDERFEDALREHWVNGKKNDVIVILGLSKKDKNPVNMTEDGVLGQHLIRWSGVLAWVDEAKSGEDGFRQLLAQRMVKLKNLKHPPEKIVQEISDQITSPIPQGGYKRKAMADFSHLASEIAMPWWANVLVVLSSVVVMLMTGWAFHRGSLTGR